MKSLTLALYFTLISSYVIGQSKPLNAFSADFLPVWNRAVEYTFAVAEAMPEEHYHDKPTPEVFSFGEQLIHIAGNLLWLNNTYIKGEPLDAIDTKAEGKTKEEIVHHLKEAVDQVTQTMYKLAENEENDSVRFFNDMTFNKKRIFLLMRDHMTHHRAQMILYLRMNGIEPPKYVGW